MRFTALYEISQLLNTQLDKETLATCVGMIESGVNPEALAVCRCPSDPKAILGLTITHAGCYSGAAS
jgi:hypothetical protein